MPIIVNEGGVLHELETVTSNEGGVLYELDTVHANEGGVLYEIHSAASFPDSLTWAYTNTSSYTPTVSNNGFTVQNTRSTYDCNGVRSNVFEIKGKVKVSMTLTTSFVYSSGTSSVGIATEKGETVKQLLTGNNGTITTANDFVELTTGRYYFFGGGGSGSQSGTAANTYTIKVSFHK